MAVSLDLIDSGALERTPAGYRAEVIALVRDVNGDVYRKRFNALRDPQLPAYGSVHPAEPSIYLLEQYVEPVSASPSKWQVRLVYRQPASGEALPSGRFGPVSWSGDVTTYTEQVYQDVNGRPLFVGYQGRPTRVVVTQEDGNTITKYQSGIGVLNLAEIATVDVDRPTTILRAERWERDDPAAAAEQVTAHTNAQRFHGKAPRRVLCRGVRWVESAVAGYAVSYEFAVRAGGWMAEPKVSYQGVVPQDARIGNGIERYHVFPAADFGALAL